MKEKMTVKRNPPVIKRQIGIQLNYKLWMQFKAQCVEDKTRPGNKIEEMIKELLMERKIMDYGLSKILDIQEKAIKAIDMLIEPMDLENLIKKKILIKSGNKYICENVNDLPEALKIKIKKIETVQLRDRIEQRLTFFKFNEDELRELRDKQEKCFKNLEKLFD